jgi:hypothetical protein
MCDLPGCPSNGSEGPEEVTDDNRPRMRLEVTAASLSILSTMSRGWQQGAFGIVSDIGDKWGFEGLTRMAYCLALTRAICPEPDDGSLQRATPDSIRERIASVAGDEEADRMTTRMVTLGDQVHSAFDELVGIARNQQEDHFNKRFDAITDAEDMPQPLISTLLMTAAICFASVQRTDNVFALDQVQTALRAGVPTGDEAGEEIANLAAMFDLPDAPGAD